MILAAVYTPAVTAVSAKSIVPAAVIVPPSKPVPAVTLVTVPAPKLGLFSISAKPDVAFQSDCTLLTLALLVVMLFACVVVIPTFAALAVTVLLAATRASVKYSFVVPSAISSVSKTTAPV